jgi:hypothetical protein
VCAESEATINASELGEFAYCRRGWWLRRVCGLASGNAGALAQGRALHELHGQRTRWALRAQRAGILMLLAAVIAIGAGACLLLMQRGGA